MTESEGTTYTSAHERLAGLLLFAWIDDRIDDYERLATHMLAEFDDCELVIRALCAICGSALAEIDEALPGPSFLPLLREMLDGVVDQHAREEAELWSGRGER